MADPKVRDLSHPPSLPAPVVHPAGEQGGRPSFWVRFLRALLRILGVPTT
jgi:hypothetical protein